MRDEACDEASLKMLKLRCDLPGDEAELIAERVRRQTLRFAYTIAYRVPQFVEFVRCEGDPTRYVYKDGADPDRLIDLLRSGELVADDLTYAASNDDESTILDLMRSKRWEDLITSPDSFDGQMVIKRRFPYTGIDVIRNRMRRGDR